MTDKIVRQVPQDKIMRDLERYVRKALELGATDAKIINASDVIIDERVRAKCAYPKCSGWGSNPHCPPHASPLSDVRALVAKYRYAIFIDLQVPPEYLAGPDIAKKHTNTPSALKLWEIVAKVESGAFYDGYYFAVGFACGTCKFYFCPNIPCQALEPGKGCRHQHKARSSMEGSGMDVYAMATAAGWDIYPIGAGTGPEDVPHGHRLGLVLVC